MKLPQFTAQASLYKTSKRYRASGSAVSGLPATQSVVAAYYPGPNTQHRCTSCLNDCAYKYDVCTDHALYALVVDPLGILTPLLLASCNDDLSDCRDQCATPP